MYLLFWFLIGDRNTLTYKQKIKAYMKIFSSDKERLKVKAFRMAVPCENVSNKEESFSILFFYNVLLSFVQKASTSDMEKMLPVV